MKLETQRLRLRRPEIADAAAYAAIHNSLFALRYNAMQPTTAERMEKAICDEAYANTAVYLEEKGSGTLIGAIFLEEDSLRYGVASRSLSYMLAEEYSRKGYMKEAMKALIPYLFREENLDCVSARVFVPNAASRALLKSLGFRENGILPHCVKGYADVIFDDVLYTLFPQDLK